MESSSSDHDLAVAERDSNLRETSMRNETYRQAISELAGDVYQHVYMTTLQQAMNVQRREWGINS